CRTPLRVPPTIDLPRCSYFSTPGFASCFSARPAHGSSEKTLLEQSHLDRFLRSAGFLPGRGFGMHETFRLRFKDRIFLSVAALLICVPTLLIDHGAGVREAAFAQSLREMSENGNWLLPTVGGLPWLTTLPVAQWFALGMASLFGVSNTLLAIRLAGIVPALLASHWTASFAATCSGRRPGILAGFALLTTLGVAENVWNGGNIIWLVAAGSGFMSLLARLEDRANTQRYASARAVVSDSLRATGVPRVLGVFVLLGLTTTIAGPIAASVAIIVPAAGHVLWRRETRLRLNNPWFFGWMVTAAIACAWPVVTMLHVADSSGFWFAGVLAGIASRQPTLQLWELLQISLPWIPLAILGQWSLRHDAFAGGYSRERLLACWSISIPVAVFVLTPSNMDLALAAAGAWSVSAAIGVERLALRIFNELPMLETRHNRTLLQKFLAGCAAVLTLSIVWSDHGRDSRDVNREVLLQARTLVSQGQQLTIDMNLGDQAAVLLFELGNHAVPLQQMDLDHRVAGSIVISSADFAATLMDSGFKPRLFENSDERRLAIFHLPSDTASSSRIATEVSPQHH
ncbi:MAG: hypothetical protein O3B86_18570, partial [Planctomycetota bacterium]|nr:hypothetical protein [Planctomycetota bacterium]